MNMEEPRSVNGGPGSSPERMGEAERDSVITALIDSLFAFIEEMDNLTCDDDGEVSSLL